MATPSVTRRRLNGPEETDAVCDAMDVMMCEEEEEDENGQDALPPEVWYIIVTFLGPAGLAMIRDCSRMFREHVDRALRFECKASADLLKCHKCVRRSRKAAGLMPSLCESMIENLGGNKDCVVQKYDVIYRVMIVATDTEALGVFEVLMEKDYLIGLCVMMAMGYAEKIGKINVLLWFLSRCNVWTDNAAQCIGMDAVDANRIDVLEFYSWVVPRIFWSCIVKLIHRSYLRARGGARDWLLKEVSRMESIYGRTATTIHVSNWADLLKEARLTLEENLAVYRNRHLAVGDCV